MRFVGEPAFVLHARAWRETSLLVEVLSAEHGRIGLVARGVQGPKKHVLRAALQPLQSIRFDGVQQLQHTGIFPASKSAGQIVEDTAFCFTQGSFIFCRGCLQNFSGQHFSKYCQAFH